ncbi:hypothetical protein MNBD_GAMMA08-2174 [hydrothermal vent metagenome]|uniref:Uncharacterized protein n=1 Tax=hydrothermal vent metagenome TaxID=652676 RepID=A0A3B0WXC4_9ZZZZ
MFLKVLAATLLILALGVYLSTINAPQNNQQRLNVGFPWKIENLESGHTRVFNLIVGQSTLHDAQQQFKEIAEITLFYPPDKEPVKEPVIEAFFNDIKIAGLKSKMVMSIELPADKIIAMFERGARIATLGSGTRKVTLSSADAALVRQSPITSITYLPSINLSAELLEKRFGQPNEKIADAQSDAVHWLYPEKGVDIALSESEKDVILYVMPEKFDALIKPLKNK